MKIISFYSDKGGAGKSFLTMWVASILKYKFDIINKHIKKEEIYKWVKIKY